VLNLVITGQNHGVCEGTTNLDTMAITSSDGVVVLPMPGISWLPMWPRSCPISPLRSGRNLGRRLSATSIYFDNGFNADPAVCRIRLSDKKNRENSRFEGFPVCRQAFEYLTRPFSPRRPSLPARHRFRGGLRPRPPLSSHPPFPAKLSSSLLRRPP